MKVTEEAVREILSRWRPRLGLDGPWTVEVSICTNPKKWPYDKNDAAYAIPDPAYFQATIHLNAKVIEESGEGLEETLVHELCHVVSWPVCVIARDALGDKRETTWRMLMEQMVETFTRALVAK